MNPFDPITSSIEPGLTVIEASAGTGKTFSISHLVPRLLLENDDLRIGEILLVTYTNDAAGELADRTRKVFAELVSEKPPANQTLAALRALMEQKPGGADRIQQAIRDLDLLSISTIHSFCQAVLQAEGELCALPVMPEVLVDSKDLVRESLHDIWKTDVANNESLARVAGILGWDFEEDLRFVTMALGLPEILVEPDPPAFDTLFARLSHPSGLFEPQALEELKAFFPTVTWNKAGGTEEFRASVPETLREPRDLAAWREAVAWVAALDKSDAGAVANRNGNPARAAELRAVQTAKAVLREFEWLTLAWRKTLATRVAEHVDAALRTNRLTTFDGMVKTLDGALRGLHGGTLRDRLRKRFKVALVDESQDTDGAQFRIFEKIFLDSPNHSLVLIGDPKQAIYAFRGADVNTYLAAKNRPGAKVFTLSRTYRSPQPLVDCVNALFDHPRSFHKANLEFHASSSGMDHDTWLRDTEGETGPGPRLEAWLVPDSNAKDFSNGDDRIKKIADAVASAIARLLGVDGSPARIFNGADARDAVPADFAVLVAQNHEAVAIHDALKARGIPAIRKTDEDVLESEEARELLTLLAAVNAPLQAKARRAALATRLLGKTDHAIRGIEENAADETVSKFQLWKQEWTRRGISSALALIDAQEGISMRLAAAKDGERRLTNFRHLTDILSGFAAVSGGKPNRLLIWLEQEIARASESGTPPEERLLQLESDRFAVKVATMHAAKGLEFPLVFCPFLWTSKDPKKYQVLNRGGVFSIVDADLCDESVRDEIRVSLLEERLRLAYVALTRAKVKLWLCAGAVPGPKGTPSALDWLLRADRNADFPVWAAAAAVNRGSIHRGTLEGILENPGVSCVLQDGLPKSVDGDYARPGSPITCLADSVVVEQTFWRTTSFSQLTREKNAKGESPVEPSTDDAAAAPNAFGSIPGGAVLGTAVHDFLEDWDFQSVPPLPGLEKHFASYPLAKGRDALPSAAGAMLGQLRESVLPGMGCDMSMACRTPRTSEWQFHLPVIEGFGIDVLAEQFSRHGDDDYAMALLKLGSDRLEGFLQGFIDKIAVRDSAFGVIDWKTNRLPAYDDGSLRKAARASHYWLQTHLYLVALRRYLGRQADIRGAWLVYLRGVRAASAQGILHISPDPALLDALDALFKKPAP